MVSQQTHHRAEAVRARSAASFTSGVLVILLLLLLLAEPPTAVADLSESTANTPQITPQHLTSISNSE